MKNVEFLKQNNVNVDKSLELFGDIETYNETLETFLAEVETKLDSIKKYKEIADMANYAILVHSLKSDAKYFGFELLAELSYKHELESKANNIYFVYDNFDSLMNEANRIINVVKLYFGKEVKIKQEVTSIKDKAILVVDDSEVISGFVKKIFNDEYEVITAKDGLEAINIINTNNKLVAMLLDLNMPNVDGFQVLNYLNNNNLFAKLPVSIITGVGDDFIVNQAFMFPIKDVLRKPFNERDVRNVLNKMII